MNDLICFECDSEIDIQQHHVVPRSKGGKRTIPLCGTCHNAIHDSTNATNLINHSRLIKDSLRKAKERGQILGRRKTRNDILIRELWFQGLSLMQIAEKAGCSKTTVVREVKLFKEQYNIKDVKIK